MMFSSMPLLSRLWECAEEADELLLVFTHLDPSSHQREFHVGVHVEADNVYTGALLAALCNCKSLNFKKTQQNRCQAEYALPSQCCEKQLASICTALHRVSGLIDRAVTLQVVSGKSVPLVSPVQ